MPVRESTLKCLFAIVILALLAAPDVASAKGEKGKAAAGKTRITSSCKPCQPTADKLGAAIDEQKRLAKRAKEMWENADRMYKNRVQPASDEVWHFEEKVKSLEQQIKAQKKTLRDLRVKLSKTARIVAHVNGLNKQEAQADSALHRLQDQLILAQKSLASARDLYRRESRRERSERDWSRKIKKQAELKQAEVDGLRRALAECEKQCKGKTAGGTNGTVGGGTGTTLVPGGKASTRCLPCDGTTKAINRAMDELRGLRAKLGKLEARRRQLDAEGAKLGRDIKTIEAGGTKAARDERRNLAGQKKSLRKIQAEWHKVMGERDKVEKQIEKKKAELGGLWMHLSECEKKCKVGTRTSFADPTTNENMALAQSSAAVFGGGSEQPRTLPPAAYYGGTGPTAGDAMASGFGLALGMAGSVPVSVETPEPEPAAAPVDEPVATNPCDVY